mgnify:CR=1 FL=1
MNSAKKHLLLVGGTGFLGSHILHHAAKLDWQITVLGKRERSFSDSSSISYHNTDLGKKTDLAMALGDIAFDYVINCAGYVDHTLYFQGGRATFDAHFTSILNLVDVINKDRLQCFINIGSSDEYGNCIAPQREEGRESPISPYAMGKVAANHFLQMLYRTEKFPAVTLRCFLVYGPGQNLPRFLPQVIHGCLKKESFPTSMGEQLRDFCYIDDVVDAIFIALRASQAHGEVINIASGIPTAIRDILMKIQTIVGAGEPLFGKIPYRVGENMALYADISKARALLDWSPKVTLDEGLKNTIAWISERI